MKTQFALHNFDKEKILQRNYFSKLNLPSITDAEILSDIKAVAGNNLKSLQEKLSLTENLLETLSAYKARIERHAKRLNNYVNVIAHKAVADETANLAHLKANYQEAGELILKYIGKFTVNTSDESPIKIYTNADSISKAIDGLFVELIEISKELAQKERLYYREIFAERLKTARKSAGLTQKSLGDLLGIKRRHISDYENLLYEPSLANLVKIAQELNRPVGWFLGVE